MSGDSACFHVEYPWWKEFDEEAIDFVLNILSSGQSCPSSGITRSCSDTIPSVHEVSSTMVAEKEQEESSTSGSKEGQRIHCPYCNMTFAQKFGLTRHIRSKHHVYKPSYKCGFCSKSFSRKDGLKRHEKSCRMKYSLILLPSSELGHTNNQ
jgi:DNA-directed RNA polymerase subunit RPC12/RpoP